MKCITVLTSFCCCAFSWAGAPPVNLEVSSGQQQQIVLSRQHLNRIVTPFSAPQVRTIEEVEMRMEGPVIYLSSLKSEPYVVYITPHDSETEVISLLVTPTDAMPREIRLTLSGQVQTGHRHNVRRARQFEEAADYQQTVVKILSKLARGEVPDGYELSTMKQEDVPVCQQDGLVFDFASGQRIQGHRFLALIGTVRNTSEQRITFQERSCRSQSIAAVAAWPKNRLLPGQRRELFVLTAMPEHTTIPVARSSLLGY